MATYLGKAIGLKSVELSFFGEVSPESFTISAYRRLCDPPQAYRYGRAAERFHRSVVVPLRMAAHGETVAGTLGDTRQFGGRAALQRPNTWLHRLMLQI